MKLAAEFLALTAARTSEVRLAEWSEIDLGARVWTIPAERMEVAREHRIPLSDREVEILTEALAVGSSGVLFPSPKGGSSGVTRSATCSRPWTYPEPLTVCDRVSAIGAASPEWPER